MKNIQPTLIISVIDFHGDFIFQSFMIWFLIESYYIIDIVILPSFYKEMRI